MARDHDRGKTAHRPTPFGYSEIDVRLLGASRTAGFESVGGDEERNEDRSQPPENIGAHHNQVAVALDSHTLLLIVLGKAEPKTYPGVEDSGTVW